MPLHEIFYIAIIAVVYLLDAVAAVHILLNKRDEPERAALWLLIVLSFPILGILLYLVAGLNRRDSLGFKIETAGAQFDAIRSGMPLLKTATSKLSRTDLFISKEFEEGLKTISYRVTLDRMLPETCPLSGNRIELLCDGSMTYPMMLDAIKRAKSSIHMQSFIIANDRIGRMIFDALEERAGQGVRVKVIYDRFGSFPAFFGHFFKRYGRSPNLKIVPYSPSNLLIPWRVQLRNHRKLLIVDGETAFLGGINISSENLVDFHSRDKSIHDLHCMLRGPAVGELQLSFLRDWCYSARRDPSEIITEEYFPASKVCGDNVVRVVSSGHGHIFEGTEKVFFTAVSTAKKFIWIMSPYFVPDKPFVKALRMASMRGVEIRVIVPAKNNHLYVKLAINSLYEPLISDGIRIFERQGPFSHAKAMLVDGEWAFVGSSNCDVRSFRLNYELDIVVTSGSFLHNLHSQLGQELAQSHEVVLEEVLSRKMPQRLAENFCALFTPVL